MSDGATTSNAAVDSGAATPKKADTSEVIFTAKEEQVLKVAWSCLKSGPPEVDIQKLTELGGFKTQKVRSPPLHDLTSELWLTLKYMQTAQNTWGAVKKKLMAMTPASTNAGEDGAGKPLFSDPQHPTHVATHADCLYKAFPAKTPATPKAKATPTPKKRTKKAAAEGEEGGEGETASPKKKARTPAKKKSEAKVKEEPEAEGDGEMEG